MTMNDLGEKALAGLIVILSNKAFMLVLLSPLLLCGLAVYYAAWLCGIDIEERLL